MPSFLHAGFLIPFRENPALADEAEARQSPELALLTILAARGLPVSPEQEARIRACQALETLEQWLRRAVMAPSVAAVLE